MIRIPRLLPFLFSLVYLAAPFRVAAADSLIVHAGSSAYRFEVELATTPEQREKGLMFRESLGANAGMLFLYPNEQPVSFWMKNTLIPLDMLFIKADGTVAHIAHDAVPHDETPIGSGVPVEAVLEVKGGTAAALGIKDGDKVEYKGLGGS